VPAVVWKITKVVFLRIELTKLVIVLSSEKDDDIILRATSSVLCGDEGRRRRI